jgi:Ca2+/H+ antiporter
MGTLSLLGGPVVRFLQAYWKQIIVVVAIVLIYLYWVDRTHTIKTQADTIVQLKAANANLTQAVVDQQNTFKATISSQNAQIEGFVKQTAAQQQRILDAQKKQDDIKTAYDKKIYEILHEVKPTTCQESIDYLINASKELKWEPKK